MGEVPWNEMLRQAGILGGPLLGQDQHMWTQFTITTTTDQLLRQQEAAFAAACQPPPGVVRGSAEDRERLLLSGQQQYHEGLMLAQNATIKPSRKKSPIYCGHANESSAQCPCPSDCYCKEHSCKVSPKNRQNVLDRPFSLTLVRLPMWIFRWIPRLLTWLRTHLKE